jgi:hypothetical protein
MDESKIFPFEAEVTECTLPETFRPPDDIMYYYHFRNTSTDAFQQIKVTFEVNIIPFSRPNNPQLHRFLFEKEYSIIDWQTDIRTLYALLHECIVDAYGKFKAKAPVAEYSYLDVGLMKLRDIDEEEPGFVIERFGI